MPALHRGSPSTCLIVPRKIRIAFVSFDFGEYSIEHANGLVGDNDVMLLLPKDLFDPHAHQLNSKVDARIFRKPRLRQPLRQLACLRWITKQINGFQPDVIHFQRGHMWFNLALYFLKRFPLVITIHDPRHHAGDHGSQKTPQALMDFAYRQADQVIVHGKQLKTTVAEEIGIAEEKIHVIPHIAIGERPSATYPSHISSQELTILFFGRIWPYKGLEYLIRAQPLINREIPNAKIWILGRGESMNRYLEMMDEPEKFVVNNRWISDEERTAAFQKASVVALPYVEATQSGVVPIAYAHSKPVVATRTGGLPDVIDDGKTGFLIEPRNEFELAQAILKLLKDPKLRAAMGNAGHRKLKNELSPAVVCRQTEEVYQLAIATHKRQEESIRPKLSKSV